MLTLNYQTQSTGGPRAVPNQCLRATERHSCSPPLSARETLWRHRKSGLDWKLAGNTGSRPVLRDQSGCYCLTESLRKEVEQLGIEVTAIKPGYFRTNFLSHGHKSRAAHEISDYESALKDSMTALSAYDKKQPGDPVKGARLIVEALTKSGRCQGRHLPSRLALGNDAVQYIAGVMDTNRKHLDEWKDLTSTTDCENSEK